MKQQQTILFLIALTCGVFFVCCLATSGEQDAPVEADLQKPSLGKVMSFDFYVQKYNKHYPNAVEAARRAKLFMSRAFQVFVSSVKYLYKRASKYLKINPHSDWTQSERDVITSDDRTPAGGDNTKGVEILLAEDPKFAALLDTELKSHQRKRRSANEKRTNKKRKLAVEDLIGEPELDEKMPKKYTPSVPSNNPDYEEPDEMFSEGADDLTEQVKPLPEAAAKELDQQPQPSGYLGMLSNGIKNVYGYLTRDDLADLDQYEQAAEATPTADNDFPDEDDLDDDDDDEYDDQDDEMFLDYRATGCLLQPKNQLQCGSCYAFTAMAMLEFHHCRQKGKLVPFSEQYIIDCAPERTSSLDGCNGGVAGDVGWYVERYGLELSVDYPYRARQQTCPYPKDTSARHMGHSKLDQVQVAMIEDDKYLKPPMIKYLLQEKGPLFIVVVTGDDFSDFGGGVDVLRCNPNKEYGHAMVLVGHGIENGREYWLIRNSHGVSFGVQGHYKLSLDVPAHCLVRVGYISGQFKRNKSHKGKELLDGLKKKSLLAQFVH